MIVGTAGHIDHGKTALVRALTGVDTDRLPEEKRRGMTIDLGFAPMELPGVGRVGVVDVPGHERFVRNMVAGATGIDVVLLIVAADDGVMPQTVEHLDIVSLLGVTRGVVALTKCDLADAALREAGQAELRRLLEGTALAASPIVAVSARTGEGLEDLRLALSAALGESRDSPRTGYFRLPIDRAFVRPGFGAVVTGTIASGHVAIDDQLRLLPGGNLARVRGMQVHGERVARALAGSRCALNLASVDVTELRRGMMAVDSRLQHTTSTVDARVTLSGRAPRPIRNHQRLRLHSGTAETIARVLWVGEAPGPGGTGVAQLRLADPLPMLHGDRFLLRDEEARATLAGGWALDCHAARRATCTAERRERLTRLGTAQALEGLLDERGAAGWSVAELAERMALLPESLAEMLAKRPEIVHDEAGAWIAPRAGIDTAVAEMRSALLRFQREHPRMTAMPLATLQASAGARLNAKVFRRLVDKMCADGKAALSTDGIRTPDHAQRFTYGEEALAGRIVTLIEGAAAAPLRLASLAQTLGVAPPRLARFLGELERAGRVARLGQETYIASARLARWRDTARELLATRGQFALGDFRDAIGEGRGIALLALERFDREGLTVRAGDRRTAGRGANGAETRRG